MASARTLAERLQALPIMRHALSARAPLAAVYAGYDDGSFFLLRPLLDPISARMSRRRAWLAAGWCRHGGRCPGPAPLSHLFLDESLVVLERRVGLEHGFDPRSRPWFGLAKTEGVRVLTDPYVLNTTLAPGVTVSVRSPAGSVIGVDVTLESLSDLLSELRIMPGMRVACSTLSGVCWPAPSSARPWSARGRAAGAGHARPVRPAAGGLQPAGTSDNLVSRDIDTNGVIWKTVVLPLTDGATLSLAVGIKLDTCSGVRAKARDLGPDHDAAGARRPGAADRLGRAPGVGLAASHHAPGCRHQAFPSTAPRR